MNKNIRFITECSLLISLAFILNFLSFNFWWQGGSISFQMVPLFIISYRWGRCSGIIAGFIFGLLQLLSGAYIIHPIQALLDYPLAFCAVGLSASMTKKIQEAVKSKNQFLSTIFILWGTFIGTTGRFICHFLSAILFFTNGSALNKVTLSLAIGYNVSDILPSFIISAFILIFLSKMFPNIFNI